MTDPTNTPDLLPCPFCGAEAALSQRASQFGQRQAGFRVSCKKRHTTCPVNLRTHHKDSAEKAASEWNTRPQPATPSPVTVKPLVFVENRNDYWSAGYGYQVAYTHKDLWRVRLHGKVVCKEVKGRARAIAWANNHHQRGILSAIQPEAPNDSAAVRNFAATLRNEWETQGMERMNAYLRKVAEGGSVIPEAPNARAEVSPVLLEMFDAAVRIGPVEWGATDQRDVSGHLSHTKTALERTAKHFGQTGPQAMHGLYVTGSETVLCHTGTSPNSPTHARILTALWNKFVSEGIALIDQPAPAPLSPKG